MALPNYANIFPNRMIPKDASLGNLSQVSPSTYNDERKKEEQRRGSDIKYLRVSHHGQKDFWGWGYYTTRILDQVDSLGTPQRNLQVDKVRLLNLFTLSSVTPQLEQPSTELENIRKEIEKNAQENLCVIEKSLYECLNRTRTDQLEKLFENFANFIKDKSPEFERLTILDLKIAKEIIDDRILSLIKEGNLKKARATLKSAAGFFPGDEHYKKFLEIIAPPKLISTKKASTKGIGETISFLKKKGNEFKNKWIAVSYGQLLGVSDSYVDLFEKHKGEDILITRIV